MVISLVLSAPARGRRVFPPSWINNAIHPAFIPTIFTFFRAWELQARTSFAQSSFPAYRAGFRPEGFEVRVARGSLSLSLPLRLLLHIRGGVEMTPVFRVLLDRLVNRAFDRVVNRVVNRVV